MKVLFDHPNPFAFAHGGFQTQIEQTKLALEQIGVEVEYLRWWDDHQRGDILHFFGRPSHWYITAAQAKGMRVVLGELLTGLGSRGARARRLQAWLIRTLRSAYFFDRMSWNAFRLADASIALTPWEGRLMHDVFGAPTDRVHTVPNGVEPEFFAALAVPRGEWLICTATITERKRVLELAQAAVHAKTPLWIIGKPYAETDPYFVAFRALATAHPALIRYEGGTADRAALARAYREARGFVLLSTMESLSLSALEAAACQCPLLLSDLPWARTSFGSGARYCPVSSQEGTASALRAFWDEAPTLSPPPRPQTWREIAEQLCAVYKTTLSLSQ